MKYVRLSDNTVAEVIPDYALPVSKWYGEKFAAQCVEAPDEVDQQWTYDPDTDTWAEPVEPEPDPDPQPVKPTLADRVTALESALSETDETAIALYESLESQQETNEAQDEALIELYELVGGE
jgi:hypothetical protein